MDRGCTDRSGPVITIDGYSTKGYYATALHELGHWTGHPSRLDRDLAHPFGSVGYAKEELRAEIASLTIGDRLGIGHDPGQHAAYLKSWVQVLQEDPKEISNSKFGHHGSRMSSIGA